MDDLANCGTILHSTLRTLCLQYPGHSDLNAVTAKVWIIGRTYATQIERHVRSDGTQGSALGRLADFLHEHNTEVDGLISEIRDDKDDRKTLDDASIGSCVRAHGQFCDLLKKLTSKHQSPRSFASKYLHFHRPILPIYDSVAAESLQKLVPWKKAYDCGPLDPTEDVYYRQYIMHLRQLNAAAQRNGLSPTVMELDWYLMHMAV